VLNVLRTAKSEGDGEPSAQDHPSERSPVPPGAGWSTRWRLAVPVNPQPAAMASATVAAFTQRSSTSR
jgi:hypothetical protein